MSADAATPGSAALIAPAQFVGLDGITHLAAGGETPTLKSHRHAVDRFMADKSGGMPGRARFFDVVARVREKVGRLSGMTAADVAFLINASEGLSLAAARLDLHPGDNVVVAPADFPSVVLAARSPAGRDVETRPAGDRLVPTVDDYAAAVDERTRAIFVSHVSHLTGARIDLAALRGLADTVGARLIVDASHALGVVPVDGRLCDVVVACCYKWLLGVHGCGLFCVNGDRWPDLTPRARGWHSVVEQESALPMREHALATGIERFESGNPPFLALYVLDNGLDHVLALEPQSRLAHCQALAGQLREGLAALGFDLLTPEPPERRAANVSFAADDPMAFEARLREAGVMVWAGEQRVRISPYLYNDAADVERCLGLLGRMR